MDADQADAFIRDIGEPNLVLLLEVDDVILKERLKGRYKISKFFFIFIHRGY